VASHPLAIDHHGTGQHVQAAWLGGMGDDVSHAHLRHKRIVQGRLQILDRRKRHLASKEIAPVLRLAGHEEAVQRLRQLNQMGAAGWNIDKSGIIRQIAPSCKAAE